MEYRNIGKSDLKLSALTFGAWAIGGWMWGGADEKEAIIAIDAAIDHGITSIDTAPVYGFGTSEELIAKAIKGKNQKVQILTKCGLRWDSKQGEFYFDSKDNQGNHKAIYKYLGKESILFECEQSLKRLGIDAIDLYQIHWPENTTPMDEAMEALILLKEQGKIKNIGVSNFNSELLDKSLSLAPIISNQVPYSMVNRDIEKDLVPFCINNKLSILAYSPLQRGLLTGKYKPHHPFSDGDHRPNTKFFTEVNIIKTNSFLEQIKPIAENHNASISQLILAWTLRRPGITIALVGARNKHQVLENVKSMELKLSNEDIFFLDDELQKLKLVL